MIDKKNWDRYEVYAVQFWNNRIGEENAIIDSKNGNSILLYSLTLVHVYVEVVIALKLQFLRLKEVKKKTNFVAIFFYRLLDYKKCLRIAKIFF